MATDKVWVRHLAGRVGVWTDEFQTAYLWLSARRRQLDIFFVNSTFGILSILVSRIGKRREAWRTDLRHGVEESLNDDGIVSLQLLSSITPLCGSRKIIPQGKVTYCSSLLRIGP
jgi:hypothetical protein